MGRPATPEDVDAICRSLPEVELGTSWGDRPTYLVHGRGFLLFRAPDRHAVDPATGEPYEDLLVVTTPSMDAKEALVADPSTPFFTIDHFRRASAVLVSQSRLGELDVEELREVLTDAWTARAPKRLVRDHLGGDRG
ncbi:MmcQ/YjbR family DNA-binding protein [Nocardioides sp. NPDC092400]|uniref:MmcQ/YjbR family DNA-binding protein n=1 Tax=Nocardioides sp. NPDC092400 TaxID=3155196 RepID=UPI0034172EEE